MTREEMECAAAEVAAPIFAKLDALHAGLNRNDLAIAHLAERMHRVERAGVVHLLDQPPRECPHCGETIEPERRVIQ